MTLQFDGKSFCFTGQLADLKRSQAEREVRSRQGLSQKVISSQLDYLVVGSIPSLGWKHGDYGNKIEKARQLMKEKGCNLRLISEHDFIVALENTPSLDSGEIDEKILVVRYNVMVKNGGFDVEGIENHLDLLQNSLGFNVNVKVEEPFIYQDLYDQYEGTDLEDLLLIRCRMVKTLPLNTEVQSIVDDIAIGFENIDGLDGELSFSEKKEGTASFASLLKTMPQTIKLDRK